MSFLYNLSIWFYGIGIFVASFFHAKAKQLYTGRKQVFDISPTQRLNQPVWVHASSLGEFEQGRPIIERIKQQNPKQPILLTFFSPSGYEIRKNYSLADHVLYLPADTPENARKFVDTFKPKALILIKYEFWFNYLAQLQKHHIPVYSVSSIFRPTQIYFRWWGRWFLKKLAAITYFFVQNSQSVHVLKDNGIEQATACGDTRFDRVKAIATSAPGNKHLEKFAAGVPVIIAGSTWPADEEVLAPLINANQLPCKWIIAPHEIAPKHIEQIQQRLKVPTILYSELEKTNTLKQEYRVLIINNIGLLAQAYKYGKIAYIGGAFATGLHNILEPATFGLPIFFGPKYSKFQEAIDLIAIGGAQSVAERTVLEKALIKLLDNQTLYAQKQQSILEFVNQNIGASDLILEHLRRDGIIGK